VVVFNWIWVSSPIIASYSVIELSINIENFFNPYLQALPLPVQQGNAVLIFQYHKPIAPRMTPPRTFGDANCGMELSQHLHQLYFH